MCKFDMKTKTKEVVSNLSESGFYLEPEGGLSSGFNDSNVLITDSSNEEPELYIWSYAESNMNKVQMPAESIDSESYFLVNTFANKSVSDNILMVFEEGYRSELYEVLPNGETNKMGNDCYIDENEKNTFKMGTKSIVLEDDNTVKIYDFLDGEPTEKVEYTACQEMAYATANVNIRIGPDKTYKSLGILPKGASVERIATGSNDWSKVVYEDQIVYISSKYLEVQEVTDDELKQLAETVSSMVYCYEVDEFEADSKDAFDDAMTYILDSTFGVYEYYNNYFRWNEEHTIINQERNPETENKYVAKDPLKKLNNTYAYAKFPADKVEWLLENVFNQKVNRNYDSSWYYYHDGYYYASTGDGGDPGVEAYVEGYEKTEDETFIFNVRTNYYASDRVYARYKVVAERKTINDIKYWSMKKMSYKYSKEALLYREFLKNEFSYEAKEEYTVFDINNDGSMEMLICKNREDGYKEYVVYTINNSKVTNVGGFVAKGEYLYKSNLNTLCCSEDYDNSIYDYENNAEITATMILMEDCKIETSERIFNTETFLKDIICTTFVSDLSLLRY